MKAVFIDIETTGLDFDVHVILDIGVVIVDLNDYSQVQAYTSCIRCDTHDWLLADKKALEVNGFTEGNHWQLAKDDWVVSQEIEDFLVKNEIIKGKAFFICQNSSFDRPFFRQLMSQERVEELNLPYHWLDLASMYWIKFYGSFWPIPSANCIIPEYEYEISLSKDSIAKHFGIPPEEKPHRALNGVMHLIKCYKAISGGCRSYQ